MDRTFRAFVVVISEYESTTWRPLPGIPATARELASLLGGEMALFEHGGRFDEAGTVVRTAIEKTPERGTLLLHWIGHGATVADQHYLICKDSPPSGDLHDLNAFPSHVLGRLLSKSRAEQIVVVLDTCFSGKAVGDLARRYRDSLAAELDREGWERVACIIASTHSLDTAVAGRFSEGLLKALRNPDSHKRWSRGDEYLDPERLALAARDMLGQDSEPVHPRYSKEGFGTDIIPNPVFRKGAGEADLETQRYLESVFGEGAHFDLAARGIETGEVGYFFSGRRHLLAELSHWLAQPGGGLTIVTGPPGSGKSAVVGRLVTLTVPELAAMAEATGSLGATEPRPPRNAVDVAIHAKGKTVLDCARAFARVLGSAASVSDAGDIGEIVERIRALGRPLTFVL